MQVVKIITYALKTILCTFLLTTLIIAAVALFAWTYGMPVQRNGFTDLEVTSSSSGSHIKVRIHGGLSSSSEVISSVNQHRRKHCIIVVVRATLARHDKRAGDFHLEIAVPDDVDQIAFGNSRNVIWHR